MFKCSKCKGNLILSVLQLYFKVQQNPVMFVFFIFRCGFWVFRKLFHIDFQCTVTVEKVSNL